MLGVCKGARRGWLQSSDSRHQYRIVTLQHQRHDAVATTAFSGLASSQLQLVDAWGSPLCLQNAAATAGYCGESCREYGINALYTVLMHSIRLSNCGTAAHQRRPSTGSPRRVCAAKRQSAHLGLDYASSDLVTATRPRSARPLRGGVRAGPAEHYCVPFVYSKRAAAARSLVSRYGRLDVLWPLRLYHSSGELASPRLARPRPRLSAGPRACPPPVRSSPHVKL